MFKLIELALHCFYSNQYNTSNESIKPNRFTQHVTFKKHSGAHKILRIRFLCFDKCFFSIYFVKIFVLPFP